MAVVNIVPYRQLPWGGGTGLGRPTGMWVGVATAIHDGTGGVAEAAIQFQAAGDPLQALLFHLGQVWLSKSGITTAQDFQLKTQEMGWGPGAGVGFSWQMNLAGRFLDAVSGGSEIAAPWDELPKNILLGTPLPSVDPAILELIVDNSNGDTHTLMAMGYYWNQTALAALGAPRLPEGALWG